MQHIKMMGSKGDPLCPLGFHPQVRWPTRCKRCFRDYKEHGNRNKENDISLRRDEVTLSSPSLSSWTSRSREETKVETPSSWTSSSNLSSSTSNLASQRKPTEDSSYTSRFSSAASSWTSSPNLANMKEETVSVTLPRPRPKPIDTGQDETDDYRRTQYTVRRRTGSSSSLILPSESSRSSITNSTPSYSSIRDRVRTSPVPSSPTRTLSKPIEVDYTIQLRTSPGKPPVAPRNTTTPSRTQPAPPASSSSSSESTSSEEDDDDDESIAGTSTTATIVNDSELQDQIESLKKELEAMKTRCERVEREKSDILLRRLASVDTYSNRTTASEVLKLQQRVNELQSMVEDLREDKKSLSLKVGELEADLEKSKQLETLEKEAENLRNKLQAAETLCEELMDENEDMKKELRDLEEEMDEMQDNFREDQADEYSSLKKELEQTAKNCRILSFKLRKAERKSETLEAEKLEVEKKCREIAGGQAGMDKNERIRHLEQELGVANEVAQRLQKELEEANLKIKVAEGKTDEKATPVKKKAPMLGNIGKSSSGEKISRESLTRGGSQEDPVQLLRDLQDSLEREADLREQLRYAEEEAQNLRKKASRVEDDNESLVLQLKKMATKARTRKTSPTPSRLTPEPPMEKDEGISDEEDPAELRLLLELNEQEAAVLRRKVEELEGEGHNLKAKVKELQDKLTAKTSLSSKRALIKDTEPSQPNAIYEKKMKVLEEEMKELRKKLVEKERDCERLHSELTLAQKKPKSLTKSKSLDGDQQALDLKRQLQVVEQEANVLRTRNQTLESDNEKLVSENKRLLLTQGAKKSSQERANSLESKAKMKEMEKKLEEANVKLKEYEENKNKPDTKLAEKDSLAEIDKLKTQINKLESEKSKLNDSLKRLKEEAVVDILEFYTKRTPKKPTDVTTKLQMKKMVDELESEIGEILVALRKSETERKQLTETDNKKDNEKNKFKTELDDLKKKLENSQKQLKDEKRKWEKENEKLQKDVKTAEEVKKRNETEWDKVKSGLEEEKKVLREGKRKVENEKLDLEEIIDRLNAEIRAAKSTKDEISGLNKKIETLNLTLREQKKESDSLRKDLEFTKKIAEERDKQVKEKSHKLEEAEKKAKDIDDKLKKNERLNGLKKEKIAKLEKELQELKAANKKDIEEKDKEKENLKSEANDLKASVKKLESELEKKKKEVDQLETNVREEREKATDLSIKAGSAASRELKELREELTAAKVKHQDLADKLKKVEQDKIASEKASKEKENSLDREVKQLEKASSELKKELETEKTTVSKLKTAHEKEMKSKDQELANLKTKLLEAGGKKSDDIKDYEAKIARLEQALSSEKREYDELTTKYEQLEEEHVVTKAKLVMDRENIQGQVVASQRELVNAEAELRSLQETYNKKQETWDKEKKNLQEKVKDLEKESKRNSGAVDTLQLEKNKLNAVIEERNSQMEQLKKDSQLQFEQILHMRKEIEDYRKQMEDYEKVAKVQRNISADNSALDREIKELKNKLYLEEHTRKAELSTLKMRYDNRVAIITEELSNVQGQVSRFKKERDTFRHMLEGAQRTISDLKGSKNPSSKPNSDEVEMLRNQIGSLEQQISCMEDEMSEARLESSRLKTELVSERSAWEVKQSEMMSKLNEMEEERLLNSGRTKVAGLKTRLELAWTKEREDQHRLLQETSTLARDLRQTLFEVERERDKERLESKRRLDQLKKSTEEEQEENRKKLNEMQCDLLELRDAHAKLRTTNEKLRREKERAEKEKDTMKSATAARRRADQEENHKVTALLQLVDELMSLAPDIFPNRPGGTSLAMPTPPVRRKGSKSRESSPQIERREQSQGPSPSAEKSQQLQATLQRLTEATDELRRAQQLGEEERDRMRKLYAARRAQSTESDAGSDILAGNGNHKKGRLFRKSLSLEQTSAIPTAQDQIWKDDPEGSLTSFQSLDDSFDTKFQMLQRRDPSLDSRLSGGSTQSEVIPSNIEKKKSKGLFGKLKKLTKSSRSMDQESNDYVLGSGTQLDKGSDTSISSAVIEHDARGSKRDLKDRLTGMFKKSGSTSRGNSLDRNQKAPTATSVAHLQDPGDSIQRQSVSRTSPSPARSDISQSSMSRPLKPSTTSTGTNIQKQPPGSVPLLRKVVKK